MTFRNHGVDKLEELHGCSDEYLATSIGMKKAQVLKFRRALTDAGLSNPELPVAGATYSIYEAEDGFRGSYQEVVDHEKKLEEAKAKNMSQDAGPNSRVLYEMPSGFKGTWDEVHAREEELKGTPFFLRHLLDPLLPSVDLNRRPIWPN